jgi:DnaJ domain
MAAADHGGPGPDLYALLGVSREASREEIAQAWRRRARAEHPDAQPRDTAAPGRFRAVSDAYQVLSDPARRAAYDRTFVSDQQSPARVPARGTPVPVRRQADLGRTAAARPPAWSPRPPLQVGPVRVERPGAAPPAGGWDEEDIRLAVLAELALRYLTREWEGPW